MENINNRFRGAMLGAAIGDGLGATLKGQPIRDFAALTSWIKDPPDTLSCTNVTSMILVTARSLIDSRGFNPEHMADRLSAAGWRAPDVQGWDDETARDLLGGAISYGNGAAMRMTPIGLVFHRRPERAVETARMAAAITHNHPMGEDGAGLHAGAIAEIMSVPLEQKIDSTELLKSLREHSGRRRFRDILSDIETLWLDKASEERVIEVLGNSVEAHRSVPTALYSFLAHHETFPNAVLYALSLGGDANTIASMTGALAGAALGESAIPRSWVSLLQEREELLELSDRLLEVSVAAC